jgi:hypothetical protein
MKTGFNINAKALIVCISILAFAASANGQSKVAHLTPAIDKREKAVGDAVTQQPPAPEENEMHANTGVAAKLQQGPHPAKSDKLVVKKYAVLQPAIIRTGNEHPEPAPVRPGSGH